MLLYASNPNFRITEIHTKADTRIRKENTMNDFLFQERMAEEYRREKMVTAEEYNKYAHLSKKKMAMFTYKVLSKVGATLENTGTKMQEHFESLALQEQHNTLPTLAK